MKQRKAASLDEVRAAIGALTDEQSQKLKNYSRWRIRGLGRKSKGKSYEDLLQEAITLTLAGDRQWNKEHVDFTHHLIGVMRSISSHWRDEFDEKEAHLESEVIKRSSEGKELNPVLRVPTKTPNPERNISAKQRLEQIEQLVADQPLVSLIIGSWYEGMTGPEIQRALNISNTEYETAVRWLRRKVRDSGI